MGTAIAGLLILAVLFTGSFMMFRTTLFGNVFIGAAIKEATRLWGERGRTKISIPLAPVAISPCTLRVNVENTGATSIVDYPHMDVIAQFTGGSISPQRLTYQASGSAVSGEWTKTLPAPATSDNFEPGIFNPGETMEITAKLTLSVTGAGTVTIGTPNGVISTKSFSGVSPC